MISNQPKYSNNNKFSNNLQPHKKKFNLFKSSKIRLLLKASPKKRRHQNRKRVRDSNLNKCKAWVLVDKKSILPKIWMLITAIRMRHNRYKTVVAETMVAQYSEILKYINN